MDIWNALYREEASPVGPCGVGSQNKVFHLNRQIKHEISKSIQDFLGDYYDKHDLSHLYALNQACYAIIEYSVSLIICEAYESEDDFRQIVESELRYFEEISNIICLDELIHEQWEVAEGEHWSDGIIETPKNMKILGELSIDIQKTIEGGQWEMPDKVHAYMCSLTIGNYKRFDYESFTYQLSRGVDCEETINNFIPYLQEEASGRESGCVFRRWYVAEVLRLVQWAEIGNIGEQVKDFCNSMSIAHPRPIDKDFEDSIRDYLETPFALFRSDFALKYMDKQLKEYLLSCQLWLQSFSSKYRYTEDPLLHLAMMKISGIYLFGSYRLGVDQFDKLTIDNAASYLQTYQLPDTAFFYENLTFFNYLESNALIVHALWISEAHGWKRSIQRIFEWISNQLDIYGVWYQYRFDRTGYTTGLILDTIELIEGGSQITFKVPEYKKSSQVDSSNTNSESHKVIQHINIDTIQNIFGNTFTEGTPKAKTKPKKKNLSQDENTNVSSQNYAEWKDQDEAKIILEYDTNVKISFLYKEHKRTNLSISSSGRLHQLILLMASNQEVEAKKIEGYFKKTDKADKIVKACNSSLNLKIRQKHLADWDGEVEILKRTRRGYYKSVIPIMTKDDYEHEYIKNQERYENDPYKNSH